MLDRWELQGACRLGLPRALPLFLGCALTGRKRIHDLLAYVPLTCSAASIFTNLMKHAVNQGETQGDNSTSALTLYEAQAESKARVAPGQDGSAKAVLNDMLTHEHPSSPSLPRWTTLAKQDSPTMVCVFPVEVWP